MYKLKIAKKAEKFLSTVPTRELLKIMEVIEKLKEDPRPRGWKNSKVSKVVSIIVLRGATIA